MGLFDFFSISTPAAVTKSDAEYVLAGKNAVKTFHDNSVKYAAYPFKTYDDFVAHINKIAPTFFQYFGKSLVTTSYDLSRVKTIMQEMAKASEGKYPVKAGDQQIFFDALNEDVNSIGIKIGQVWKGTIKGVESAAKAGATIVGGYAAYKVAALAVAGLGALAVIIKSIKKSK